MSLREVAHFPASKGSTVHTVHEDTQTGALSCTCPGWTYQRPGQPRTCRHLGIVLQQRVGKVGGRAEAKAAQAPLPLQHRRRIRVD